MSARTVKAAIAALVVASLNLLDERDLSAEQRAKADEAYAIANSLEYSLDDKPAPAISGAAFGEIDLASSCVRASKMRADGTFAPWCVAHHHWLKEGAPAKSVLANELAQLGVGPTEEQLAALRDWRDLHGRYWRSLLNNAWLHAGEGVRGYTPALQQLRNSFGPTWLFKVRL